MKDEEIIQLIADRKENRALVKLYRYQGKVTSLIISRGGSKEDGQDIFQDALLILCKKVWEGNFKLTSKLDTYLYSVCYNIWRNQSKDLASSKLTNELPEEFAVDDDLQLLLQKESKIKQVEEVLQKLGNPCLELLTLFYHSALRVKEIVKKMGYKTENSVKVQKYKCLERAKKMIAHIAED
ncbi:MAG: RNA polymerase sigma factor (sigma-70 family) [Flavobacteriales bacterium]|jgi:RNA polymerase sigma factor (sigma-70 family)